MKPNRKWLIIIMTLLSIVTATYVFSHLYSSKEEIKTSSTSPGIFNTLAGVFNSIVPGDGNEGEPFNALILGGDKVAKNTDTIMLASFNPKTGSLSIMSIPRDTLAKLRGWETKINAAYPYGGAELAVKAIKDLMDVDVKYYFFVDTKAFRDIIDLLGGVQYNIPVDMHYEDPTQDLIIDLKAGPQTLDGDKSEQFMRFRQPLRFTSELSKYYDGSDIKRINAQQDFMKELIRQKVTLSYLPKLKNAVEIILKNTETNMSLEDALTLSKNLGAFRFDKVSTFVMPGQAAMINEGSYYLIDYEKTIDILNDNFCVPEGFRDETRIKEKIISSKNRAYNIDNEAKSTTEAVYDNNLSPTKNATQSITAAAKTPVYRKKASTGSQKAATPEKQSSSESREAPKSNTANLGSVPKGESQNGRKPVITVKP